MWLQPKTRARSGASRASQADRLLPISSVRTRWLPGRASPEASRPPARRRRGPADRLRMYREDAFPRVPVGAITPCRIRTRSGIARRRAWRSMRAERLLLFCFGSERRSSHPHTMPKGSIVTLGARSPPATHNDHRPADTAVLAVHDHATGRSLTPTGGASVTVPITIYRQTANVVAHRPLSAVRHARPRRVRTRTEGTDRLSGRIAASASLWLQTPSRRSGRRSRSAQGFRSGPYVSRDGSRPGSRGSVQKDTL